MGLLFYPQKFSYTMTKMIEYFLNTKPVNDIKELLVYMIAKGFFSKKGSFRVTLPQKEAIWGISNGKK